MDAALARNEDGHCLQNLEFRLGVHRTQMYLGAGIA
jgi:hypothetical protein